MNLIKTKHHWHPNTSLEFTATGMWMRVSLNVSAEIASRLSPNNVSRGQYYNVYALKSFIETDMICKNNLEQIQKMLLDNCMKNIRTAKAKCNEQKSKNVLSADGNQN